MSIEALSIIEDSMEKMGLKYAFMEYIVESDEPLPKTYFVGEYQELEPDSEDGEELTIFIITGFSREKWIRLEEAKEKIKKYFPQTEGKTVVVKSSAIAVFYANSLPIPLEGDELKKIQINLTVKEWSV